MDGLIELRDNLKKFTESAEKRIADLEASGKATTEEKTAQKKELDELKGELVKVNEQLKERTRFAMPGVDLSKDVRKRFCLDAYVKALTFKHLKMADPWKKADAELEFEVVEQLAKQRTSQQVDNDELGGFLVPDEQSNEIIDMARVNMPITQMGIREFRGLHGDFSMPRTTQRPTVYWLGESEKPTRSNSKLAKIWLRKKKCGAFVSLTKDFIYQSRGVGETWLKETLSTAVAEGLHTALINGKGSDSEPKGILTYTSGYTSYTEAANGQRFRFDEGAKMAFLLEDANELEGANKGGFLTSPAVKNGLQRQSVLQYSGQAAADGAPIYGSPVLTPAQVDSILGYPMKTTTHISRTLTKGNNSTCSAVIFGDWKYFALGFWRAPEIKVSDIAGDGSTGSAFLDDEVYVVMLNQVDCTFLRQTAFIVAKDAQTSTIV